MISPTKISVVGVFVAGGAVAVAQWSPFRDTSSAPTTAVKVPSDLQPQAQAGEATSDANCAQCHVASGAGTDHGPPFVNMIYNPGHHPDQAFFLAAKIGVRSHHWHFGDMPPQPQVSQQQLADIVTYVRALQEANGIFYQPHRM